MVQSESSVLEFSVKSVFFGILFSVIFAASNAYLSLKVGTSVSAAVPAAVLAMMIFRFFRRHSIQEVSLIQTAASMGEGLSAAVCFILPALIIMHVWTHFTYWETVIIIIVGGVLGVLCSIPIRMPLLKDEMLKYPEGVAAGKIMTVYSGQKGESRPLILGGIAGAFISLCQDGFQIFANGFSYWIFKANGVMGFGGGFSSALIAAGYICGINVGLSMLTGVILGWLIGIPILSHIYSVHQFVSASDGVNYLWLNYLRYIGVGIMLVGGLWTLIKLCKPVVQGIITSVRSLKEISPSSTEPHVHSNKDLPWSFILWVLVALCIFSFAHFWHLLDGQVFAITWPLRLSITVINVIYLVLASFVFCAVGGYFAGLIGSTNSPGSGLTISVLLIFSIILLTLLDPVIDFSQHIDKANAAAAFAILVTAFISCAQIVANELSQCFKAGQMVKASPWKQQVISIVSIVSVAFVVPYILDLLFYAYGIGGVFPLPGMPRDQMLAAPQAGLMAAVAQSVFSHHIPWSMLSVGAVLAVVFIFVDKGLQEFYGFGLPVLCIGLGIYLPLDASVPCLLGGLLAGFIERAVRRKYLKKGHVTIEHIFSDKGMQSTLLLACGIVAGASLMSVCLAVPFALKQNPDVLRLMPEHWEWLSVLLSVGMTILLCSWMHWNTLRKK